MAEDPMKVILHYAQALKAPRIRESAARLAEQARNDGWTHEEYLAAVLRQQFQAGPPPAAGDQLVRDLADYDRAFGVDFTTAAVTSDDEVA